MKKLILSAIAITLPIAALQAIGTFDLGKTYPNREAVIAAGFTQSERTPGGFPRMTEGTPIVFDWSGTGPFTLGALYFDPISHVGGVLTKKDGVLTFRGMNIADEVFFAPLEEANSNVNAKFADVIRQRRPGTPLYTFTFSDWGDVYRALEHYQG